MIDVVITTYVPNDDIGRVRAGYAIRSIEALKKHLKFNGELRFIMTNDGYDNDLLANVRKHVDVGMYGPRNGIGSSLNRALQHAVDNVWMYTTDDWVPTKDINLDKAYALLAEYDYIRLGPLHPDIRARTKFNQNLGWWLQLIWGEGFVFATRPFLATKAFYDEVGPFDEGLNSYETERLYNEKAYTPRYAALLSDGEEWNHIGDLEVGYLEVTNRA